MVIACGGTACDGVCDGREDPIQLSERRLPIGLPPRYRIHKFLRNALIAEERALTKPPQCRFDWRRETRRENIRGQARVEREPLLRSTRRKHN